MHFSEQLQKMKLETIDTYYDLQYTIRGHAGLAQLLERILAKDEARS